MKDTSRRKFIKTASLIGLITPSVCAQIAANKKIEKLNEKENLTIDNYLESIKKELIEVWPKNKTINLVFHGHSVPSGYFVTPDVRPLQSYPFQLLKELKKIYPNAVINIILTCIGGENSVSGAKRFKKEVLNHKPDVLFIDYALNDTGIAAAASRNALVFMIKAALKKKVKVILLTATPDQRVDLLSNALGGVIHTITESAELNTGFRAKVLLKYTPGMEKTLRPSITLGLKNIAFIASANWRNFGDLIAGKHIGKQAPTGYNEASYNFKTIIKLKNGNITAAHQNLAAQNVPVYHKIALENFKINEFGEQKRNLSYFKFERSSNNRFFENVNISTSIQNTYETRINEKNNSDTKTKETDQVQVIGFLSGFSSKFSKYHKSYTGVEAYFDLVKSKKEVINTVTKITTVSKRGLYPNLSKYSNLSLFTLHDVSFKKWLITSGLRYNYFLATIPSESHSKTILKPNALIGNFAVMRPIDTFLNIYASYNSGFRAPNIDDMGSLGLVDFRYELPNYNLKPETSRNWELGLKCQSDIVAINMAVFYNQLNNLITRVRLNGQFNDGNPIYTKENSEHAYIKGAEFNINGQLHKNFTASAGFCYLYGQNITKNEPIRRIPPFNGRIETTFTKGNFSIKPELLFATSQMRLAQGDIDDNRIGPKGTARWQVINLYAGYNFKNLKMNLLAHNLTNMAYKTHGSGVYGIGRAISLSLEVSI